jgi:hypothetical protein
VKVPPKGKYKTALGALRAAYRLISKPKHWTQDTFAKDCHGESVLNSDNCSVLKLSDPLRKDIRSEESVAFCAMGAVIYVNGPGERKAIKTLIKAGQAMKAEALNRISKSEYRESDTWAESAGEGASAVFSINDYEERRIARKNVKLLFQRAIRLAR